MTDLFLPSQCDACGRAYLTPVEGAAYAPCSLCGGRTQITPGELYRAEDADLFYRIESAVNTGALTESQRIEITAELNNVAERTRAPEPMLTRLIEVLPSLRFLLYNLPTERDRLVRGMGMLLAIVSGQLGRSRRSYRLPSRESNQGLPTWLESATRESPADSSS
jgi:hypothetical protein